MQHTTLDVIFRVKTVLNLLRHIRLSIHIVFDNKIGQ